MAFGGAGVDFLYLYYRRHCVVAGSYTDVCRNDSRRNTQRNTALDGNGHVGLLGRQDGRQMRGNNVLVDEFEVKGIVWIERLYDELSVGILRIFTGVALPQRPYARAVGFYKIRNFFYLYDYSRDTQLGIYNTHFVL